MALGGEVEQDGAEKVTTGRGPGKAFQYFKRTEDST